MRFVPQTDVQGQVGADFIIVLNVAREHARALTPRAGADAAPELVGQAKEEIRFTRAGAATCSGQRVGSCREPACEVHEPDYSVISGVISIDPLAHVLKASVNDV